MLFRKASVKEIFYIFLTSAEADASKTNYSIITQE